MQRRWGFLGKKRARLSNGKLSLDAHGKAITIFFSPETCLLFSVPIVCPQGGVLGVRDWTGSSRHLENGGSGLGERQRKDKT